MPRPRKRKMICQLPAIESFGPAGEINNTMTVSMSLEEYETIRLIDYEEMNQEQCAAEMGVARSTVQRLYTDARKKLADGIVNGKMLRIGGGDYSLCPRGKDPKLCAGCSRHQHRYGQPD